MRGGKNKLSQESVLSRFRAKHGNKYDYSNVEYKGRDKRVCIICPIHGEFWQRPEHHWNGCGCRKCHDQSIREQNLLYGVGINDIEIKTRTAVYRTWKSMLERCYNKENDKNISYIGCSVCKEWHYLSNFKQWFDDNYIYGYDLDKDILVKGNKIYSPEFCRYVPHEINSLLINCKRNRGEYPLGVSKSWDKYSAYYRRNREFVRLGRFNTIDEAFNAYKKAKERYIKEVATSYYNEGKIDKDIFNALMNWEIEITD